MYLNTGYLTFRRLRHVVIKNPKMGEVIRDKPLREFYDKSG
jgi:hypothetical protein